MQELKKVILNELDGCNADWVEVINNPGEEGIDMSVMLKLHSERMRKLDEAFTEASKRLKVKRW